MIVLIVFSFSGKTEGFLGYMDPTNPIDEDRQVRLVVKICLFIKEVQAQQHAAHGLDGGVPDAM